MADAGMHRTIPALPVGEMAAAVAFYRERLGSACAITTVGSP
jgi:hypothetical protein